MNRRRSWSIYLVLVVILMGIAMQAGTAEEAKPVTKITYWEMMWGPNTYDAAVRKLVDQYNEENPDGIMVEVNVRPWDGWYESFLTAVTAGQAPDVCTGASGQSIQYADMGYALPLTPLYEKWQAENDPILTDIPKPLFDYYNYNGELWAMPFGTDSSYYIYRKEFFEQAGITTLPTTWAEFIEVLRTLKQEFPDKVPLLYPCAESSANGVVWINMLQNNTGLIVDNKPNMQSPEALEALNFIKQLYDEGLVSMGTAAYSTAEVENMFIAGEGCIAFHGIPTFLRDTDIYDKCGYIPKMKGPSGDIPVYGTGAQGMHGFNEKATGQDSSDEVMKFIDWWLHNDLVLWTEGGKSVLPSRNSYYNDPMFSKYWEVDIRDFNSDARPGVWPSMNYYPAASRLDSENIVGYPAVAILTGADPLEAAAETDALIQTVLDDFK